MNSAEDLPKEGLPHSDIRGSTIARISPRLFAACHVLHRLLAPRHPPNALITLVTNSIARTQYQTAPVQARSAHAKPSSQQQCLTTYPTTTHNTHKTSNQSPIHLSKNRPTNARLAAAPVSGLDQALAETEQEASPPPHHAAMPRDRFSVPSRDFRATGAKMEAIGFEPTTPCLQSRCSSN
jgi:hypothetical protein